MRWGIAAIIFAIGATIVGAQGPPAASTRIEQYRLYERNRELIRELVDRTLELTTQPDALQRVETANWIARLLTKEIQQAAQQDDAHRVVELGKHLRTVLEDGIIPNIRSARVSIKPGSADERRFITSCEQTIAVIAPLEVAVPNDAPIGQLREVRETLSRIQGTRELIGKVGR